MEEKEQTGKEEELEERKEKEEEEEEEEVKEEEDEMEMRMRKAIRAALYLSVTYASNLGGTGVITGSGTNLILMDTLNR